MERSDKLFWVLLTLFGTGIGLAGAVGLTVNAATGIFVGLLFVSGGAISYIAYALWPVKKSDFVVWSHCKPHDKDTLRVTLFVRQNGKNVLDTDSTILIPSLPQFYLLSDDKQIATPIGNQITVLSNCAWVLRDGTKLNKGESYNFTPTQRETRAMQSLR